MYYIFIPQIIYVTIVAGGSVRRCIDHSMLGASSRQSTERCISPASRKDSYAPSSNSPTAMRASILQAEESILALRTNSPRQQS